MGKQRKDVPINDGYNPRQIQREGYQPSSDQPSNDPKKQGGYTPKDIEQGSGENNPIPPGDE